MFGVGKKIYTFLRSALPQIEEALRETQSLLASLRSLVNGLRTTVRDLERKLETVAQTTQTVSAAVEQVQQTQAQDREHHAAVARTVETLDGTVRQAQAAQEQERQVEVDRLKQENDALHEVVKMAVAHKESSPTGVDGPAADPPPKAKKAAPKAKAKTTRRP